jgi:muconolactone delta-isomerase
MNFLVHIEVQPMPADWDAERLADIRRREVAAVVEFLRQGVLRSPLMRIPGRNANYGVWQAESPEDLDRILRSLPLHPFMALTITPLMAHPSEQAYKDKYGDFPARRGLNDQ